MKKPRKAQGKGPRFERWVCRELSLWVSDGQRDDLFWRSAMSGGRATLRYAKGIDTQVVGDICAVSQEGHVLTDRYLIECKHRRGLDLRAFLFGRGMLFGFWVDTVKEAVKHKRRPLLIARQNNIPTIAITATREFGWPSVISEIGYPAYAVLYYFERVCETKFADLS